MLRTPAKTQTFRGAISWSPKTKERGVVVTEFKLDKDGQITHDTPKKNPKKGNPPAKGGAALPAPAAGDCGCAVAGPGDGPRRFEPLAVLGTAD